MFCAIWYHLHNLKDVKNIHEGVLLFVKLQASGYNSNKSNTHQWVFFTFFKFHVNSFNFRLQAAMILISLRKAFYKINHKTLLGKLYLLSFSKNTIIYFRSGFPDMSFRRGS